MNRRRNWRWKERRRLIISTWKEDENNLVLLARSSKQNGEASREVGWGRGSRAPSHQTKGIFTGRFGQATTDACHEEKVRKAPSAALPSPPTVRGHVHLLLDQEYHPATLRTGSAAYTVPDQSKIQEQLWILRLHEVELRTSTHTHSYFICESRHLPFGVVISVLSNSVLLYERM